MKDKKTFGSFIKEKRISKNYSQKDLAELLFVTESAVSKWERGVTYPDITLISDICKVLDVSEKELIQSSDDSEYRKIKSNSDKFNKIKKALFWSFNIAYITAILSCFIVNLAVNHTLSWFFIVLASILVAYSFCPTIIWTSEKHKKLLFIGSTFISLFILFLTCSLYTSDYWFMIPTTGTLLLYFIVFYPILFVSQKKYLNDDKYKELSKWFLLSYSLGILILLILLFICINGYIKFNIVLAMIIAGGCLVIPIIYGMIMLLSKSNKIISIVSLSIISLIVFSIIFGVGNAVYLKSTEVTNSYVIEEKFDNINIHVDTDDINIYLSDENKIVYVENKYILLEKKVKSNTLFINRIDNRKFYNKLFNFSSFKIDLYLSNDNIETLTINNSTGDIEIHEKITIKNATINNSTGKITINSNVLDTLYLENSTGNISIKNCNQMGNISIDTSTGDVNLSSVNCKQLDINFSTGNTNLIKTVVEKDFNIAGSTGNVFLDDFDAKNIYIDLSTGDVTGTILTGKLFNATSDTGNVIVPENYNNGVCKITVSTGNINIKYTTHYWPQ